VAATEEEADWARFSGLFDSIRRNVETVLQGKSHEVQLALVTLVA
jgi:hypothetical protein